jgi:hypothetical protein
VQKIANKIDQCHLSLRQLNQAGPRHLFSQTLSRLHLPSADINVIDSDDENENEILRLEQERKDLELARQLEQSEPEQRRSRRIQRASYIPKEVASSSDSDFEEEEASSKKRKTRAPKKETKRSAKKAKETQEEPDPDPQKKERTPATSSIAQAGIESLFSQNQPRKYSPPLGSPPIISTNQTITDSRISHLLALRGPSPERGGSGHSGAPAYHHLFENSQHTGREVGAAAVAGAAASGHVIEDSRHNGGEVGTAAVADAVDSGHVIEDSQNSLAENCVVDISLGEEGDE